ncbi:NADPH-dependent FMN reductase [Pedobacter yulinensis]|uniref:NADPH-dependent FMN reductase n=1 Tax=Pedobacter yulinensis TaxID=2126353 RepID=A0A2T3HKN5_9SPHI|nr:NAD(P)H-dependent oxidoreductase [Pedobacter yulinensis]PST82951.1 NADPH-dependent FMN reductase [Pedobacter yulinensis]
MINSPLVINGSARKHGNTGRLITVMMENMEFDQLDLYDFKIDPFNYEGDYSDHDSFNGIVRKMLLYETLILATPVYWYSMSGLMKTFFDRMTGLVTTDQQTGRQLAGKKLVVLAIGTDPELPAGFGEPFRLSAAYFDMQYAGTLYLNSDTGIRSNEPDTWKKLLSGF